MSHEPRFDDDEQHEWDAQENARRSIGDDALSRRYRIVMQSLDAMPRLSLDADFAARVARHVERSESATLAAFERVALIALSLAFAVALVVAGAIENVLPLLESQSESSLRWLAMLALCVIAFAFPLSRTKRERGALHH